MALLQRPGGVLMVEIAGALGIQPHSAWAAVSVETRRRGLKATLKDGRYNLE